MNIAVPVVSQQPAGVSILRDERGLSAFRDPSCAAAIWKRDIPSDVTDWLAALPLEHLPSARVTAQASAVAETVAHLCDMAETPKSRHRDWLIGDISELAKRFAALMNANYVRLRLQAVTTNACRKFHLDALTGRLVCTYRGTGTQYGTSVQDADPEDIFTTPTGAPILLRGSLWPPKPAAGLLHRSPPIEGTGETRFVLVLDPVSDSEAAA